MVNVSAVAKGGFVGLKDLSLDGPLWSSGLLTVNVEALTTAIAKLAAALQGEIEARVSLEAEVEIIRTSTREAAEAHVSLGAEVDSIRASTREAAEQATAAKNAADGAGDAAATAQAANDRTQEVVERLAAEVRSLQATTAAADMKLHALQRRVTSASNSMSPQRPSTPSGIDEAGGVGAFPAPPKTGSPQNQSRKRPIMGGRILREESSPPQSKPLTPKQSHAAAQEDGRHAASEAASAAGGDVDKTAPADGDKPLPVSAEPSEAGSGSAMCSRAASRQDSRRYSFSTAAPTTQNPSCAASTADDRCSLDGDRAALASAGHDAVLLPTAWLREELNAMHNRLGDLSQELAELRRPRSQSPEDGCMGGTADRGVSLSGLDAARLADLEALREDLMGALAKRCDELAAALQGAQAGVAGCQTKPDAHADIGEKLMELQNQLQGDLRDVAQKLRGELKDLRVALDERSDGGAGAAQLADLTERLAMLEVTMSRLSKGSPKNSWLLDTHLESLNDLEARVIGLEARSEQLGSAVATVAASSHERSSTPKAARLDALREDLRNLKEAVNRLEEGRGEVVTTDQEVRKIYNAVRGVQRDTQLTTGRLEDLSGCLGKLKAQVDMVLPRLLHAMKGQGDGAAEQFADAFAMAGLDGRGLTSASQKTCDDLQNALSALRADLDSQLGGIQRDLKQVSSNKASLEELRGLIARQSAQEQHTQAVLQSLLQQHAAGLKSASCSETPALTRLALLPAHCLACDRKVELQSHSPSPWTRGGLPASPWPQREPHCREHQPAGPPAGYRMRREASLPAIER
eukprot:TRINITY_DN25469_c0_g1_i2.p1 TRINITY_DN25469_c0_g1~~TRINITY_DN25469_c0_g1_i2.p1  ORF type:complete len:807 (-),score=208.47 TRINITY_DN25469_c0_g1_i2:220-2640(-)